MLLDDEDDADRSVSADAPFLESLHNASDENYLGDIKVVESVLRFHLIRVLDSIQKLKEDAHFAMLDRISKQVAKVFLGKDASFTPVPGWNVSGKIDEALANQLSLLDDTPQERVQHAFLKLVNDVLRVSEDAGTFGILDEQWGWHVDAVLSEYTGLFLGQSISGQMTMMFER